MKEILELIIKSLVSDDATVEITEIAEEKEVKFEVRVSGNNMGRIIGKNGNIAKSIRSVMRAIGTKENKRVSIEFVD